jgi:hypothetical protein
MSSRAMRRIPATAMLVLVGGLPGVTIDVVEPAPPRGQLRIAVAAAIEAYARTSHMLDAALAYAAHGFPVFPVGFNKKPVPARDKDAEGNPIPGTGGFKKATCDPIQIHAWWDRHEYLVAMPMGARVGVWCLDVDSSEDHADGIAKWNEIAAQHAPITTREHRSATGGPHLIFEFHADLLNGCSNGNLPDGIDVKRHGSYIVVPPSERKKRSYTVFHDIDPTDQPEWLTELILKGQSRRSLDGGFFTGRVTAGSGELADATSFIPNVVGWVEWKNMALRLYAALGDDGFVLFDAWSQKAEIKEYDPDKTIECWEQVQSCPPTRTGAEVIFRIARENGWVRKRKPPPAVNDEVDVETARSETRRIIRKFLERVAMPESEIDVWLAVYFDEKDTTEWPFVWAVLVETGVGKTEQTIEELAIWLRKVVLKGPVIYAVPQHKLSVEIEKKFAERSINARRFLGRGQVDPKRKKPDLPDDAQQKMCLNPIAVDLAKKCHASISDSCCYQSKKKRCRFYDPGPGQCGYQEQQIDSDEVQVWIVASDMLFQTHKVFGRPAVLIIDESIWRKGLRGVEGGDETRAMIAIDRLLKDGPFDLMKENEELDSLRNQLGRALQTQEQDGGVERQHLSGFSVKDCDRALYLEWKFLPKFEMHPGMSDDEVRELAKDEDLIAGIRHTRRMVGIWKAVRELLCWVEVAVSGRLFIKTIKDKRVIKWRGVAPISKQFWVETLLLDATLPQPSILRVYHPQVETVAHIKVAMSPFVHVRQVLEAPTGSRKLDDEKHLEEVYRYILQRYLECGSQDTLIISQLKVEEWLKTKGLPENIYLEHYNNITGLDKYRIVRLQIMVGRTAPGPREVEAMAGAMSGSKPVEVKPNAKGFVWYPQAERVIRLQDGSGRVTLVDYSPDPTFGEPIRWLVNEGELVQSEGRPRGVNRTAENPARHRPAVQQLFAVPSE